MTQKYKNYEDIEAELQESETEISTKCQRLVNVVAEYFGHEVFTIEDFLQGMNAFNLPDRTTAEEEPRFMAEAIITLHHLVISGLIIEGKEKGTFFVIPEVFIL